VTAVWVTIAVLAFATAGLKLVGPLVLGGRPLPASAMSTIGLLASALLAALVVVETFGKGRSLSLWLRHSARAARSRSTPERSAWRSPSSRYSCARR
jgi:hypothetical protein